MNSRLSLPSNTLVCDFCADRNAAVTFFHPAKGHDIEGDPFLDETIAGHLKDDNGYLGCDECTKLIREDRWNELVDRSVTTFIEHNPMWKFIKQAAPKSEEEQRDMEVLLWQMVSHHFEKFASNRMGWPRPI